MEALRQDEQAWDTARHIMAIFGLGTAAHRRQALEITALVKAALVAQLDAREAALRTLAEEFVTYWTKGGGCGYCGGLPHSTGCHVGRFQTVLESRLRGRAARDTTET